MRQTKSTSIRRTFLGVQLLVGLLLVFLLVQGAILWQVCRRGTVAAAGLENEGLPSLKQLAVLEADLVRYRLHCYELMFVAEKDRQSKLQLAEALHRENLQRIAHLKKLFPDGAGLQHVLAVEAGLVNYAAAVGRIRSKIESDFPGAMQILDQEVPGIVAELSRASRALAGHCERFSGEKVALAIESFGSIRKAVLGLGSASTAFAALVLVLVLLSSWRLRRVLASLVERLTQAADQVNSSSGAVADAGRSLADGASEQAAALEQTSASLEEMAGMTQRNTETAGKVKALANAARTAGDSGAADIRLMTAAMSEIQKASDDVAKIVKTIDEIAFQTNILALNAAVEAARAGEAGMGFAVVADEVRNLAGRAAEAAKETAARIEDSVRKSQHGAQISIKVAASLQEIIARAREVDELAAQVATASAEQSQGIQQINGAVNEMDRVTQANAATAKESASAAVELRSEAGRLQVAVKELHAVVEGAGAGAVGAEFVPQSDAVSLPRMEDRSGDGHPAGHANGESHGTATRPPAGVVRRSKRMAGPSPQMQGQGSQPHGNGNGHGVPELRHGAVRARGKRGEGDDSLPLPADGFADF